MYFLLGAMTRCCDAGAGGEELEIISHSVLTPCSTCSDTWISLASAESFTRVIETLISYFIHTLKEIHQNSTDNNLISLLRRLHTEDDSAVMEVWPVEGVKAGLISRRLEVNPRWSEGRLWGELPGPYMCIFKAAVFWVSLVHCRFCMSFSVPSFSVGLETLVSLSRTDLNCTDYHLHGSVNLTRTFESLFLRRWVASCVLDALLAGVLIDDRVAKR